MGPAGVLYGEGVVEDFLPDVVCPVGRDRRDDERLEGDIGCKEVAVHRDGGSSCGFAVKVAGGGEVVNCGFKGHFVICAFVVSVGLVDEGVHFVLEELIPEVSLRGAEGWVVDDALAPFFEGVHAEDYLIGDGLLEVGIFDAVPSVSESNPCRIRTVFGNCVVKGKKLRMLEVDNRVIIPELTHVAGRFGHFVAVEHEVSVYANARGTVLPRKEGKVNVEEESKMISDEIFPAYSYIQSKSVRSG